MYLASVISYCIGSHCSNRGPIGANIYLAQEQLVAVSLRPLSVKSGNSYYTKCPVQKKSHMDDLVKTIEGPKIFEKASYVSNHKFYCKKLPTYLLCTSENTHKSLRVLQGNEDDYFLCRNFLLIFLRKDIVPCDVSRQLTIPLRFANSRALETGPKVLS